MNVRNCKKCGKIFNYVMGAPICPSCRDKLEEQFKAVKEYIWDNKECSVADVVENCGVDRLQIQQWIREERLELFSGIGVTCEKCGVSISTGRFCEKCKAELTGTFTEASARKVQQEQKPKSVGTKMRFLDR